MPKPFRDSLRQPAIFGNNRPINTRYRSHKELDTEPDESIIVFTDIAEGLPAANGRSGHQTPDAPTTGNAAPAPESRTRRVVSPSKKTTLNGASDTPAIRQDLAAHYEQLRRDAIGRPTYGGQGLGLALFLRRGMTAWMQAWSECAGNVEPGPRSQSVIDEPIPGDIRSQITTLLAGMILCLQQEATS